MNKEKCIVLGAVLILIGASAGYLAGVGYRQRLGNPGLKMVRQPVLDEDGKVVGTNTVALPLQVLDYSSKPLPVTTNELGWLPKDTTFARRRYLSRGDLQTDVSIVLMGQDRTSIHKPEICLTGQGWRIEKRELLTIPMSRPHQYDLPVMKLTAGGESRDQNGRTIKLSAVFVYWFVSENRLTARHRERVWWMAKDLITTGVLQRWASISYLSFCRPGQEDVTFNRMKEFIAASVPEFQIVHGSSESASPLSSSAVAQKR